MADYLRKFYAKFSYIFSEKCIGVEYIRNKRLYKLLYIGFGDYQDEQENPGFFCSLIHKIL